MQQDLRKAEEKARRKDKRSAAGLTQHIVNTVIYITGVTHGFYQRAEKL